MTAWSYSSLNQFLTCGKQYHEVRVLKRFKDEPSEQLLWGDRVHKYMEQKLHEYRKQHNVDQSELSNRNRPKLLGRRDSDNDDGHSRAVATSGDSAPAVGDDADEFAPYAAVAMRFAQTKGILATEQKLAITNAFKPTEWFAPDVWCRGVLDARWLDGSVARVVDWKTGKRKPDSKQLLLFALLVFACHPEVNRVNTAFVWLQTGKIDTAKFFRKDVSKLWQEILPEVRRLEYAHKTMTFIPKPSGICNGWCPVKSCTFWNGAKSETLKGAA